MFPTSASRRLLVNGSPVTGLTTDPSAGATVSGSTGTIFAASSFASAYDRLVSAVFTAAPTKVIDLYVGDNITDASVVATWPGVVPNSTTLAAAGSAGGFGIATNPRNGRKYCYSTTSENRALTRATSAAVLDVIVVYRQVGKSMPQGLGILAAITGSVYPLMCARYADQWNTADSGNPTHYLDGYACHSVPIDNQPHVVEGVIAGNTTTGLRIGGFDGYSMCVQGDIYCVIPFNAVLTAGERATITAALMEYYAIRRPRGLFADGNSIVTGHPTGYDWVNAVYQPHTLGWNIGTAGHTWADVLSGLAAGLATKDYANLRDTVWFCYEDCNSIIADQSTATVIAGKTAAAEAAEAAGCKVVLATCMPSYNNMPGARDTTRLAVNAATRVLCAARGWGCVDFAAHAAFQDSTNLTIFGDGLHLTDYGYWLFGAEVRKAVALAA